MKACGLIVEYNPYHNGHHYHFQQAKKVTHADCMIAVMSGNFLQRGEPAIIDKYARAQIAVEHGIDLVIELPYYYAVQHSELFAKGAIKILDSLHATYVCFGSEHGKIRDFYKMDQLIKTNKKKYDTYLKEFLAAGHSYPKANELAYLAVGGDQSMIDFEKPNNILGYQYVKNILDNKSNIEPFTIKRIKNDYHDRNILDPIASATSIRQHLLSEQYSTDISTTLPQMARDILHHYRDNHGSWHSWEQYFRLLKYRVMTMKLEELQQIHGVREGIENRLKKTAKEAADFFNWMKLLKTKRYTWTSLQRIFANILTNTTTEEMETYINKDNLSGIRLLAMSENGRVYLNKVKKKMVSPVYTSNKKPYPNRELDERVDYAYYSILPVESQKKLLKQSYTKPIMKTPT